jgi:hypothetical protein
VAGTVEFELSLSDEYVQGFVKDIDQKFFRQLRPGSSRPRPPGPARAKRRPGPVRLLRFVRENYLAGNAACW